jgi:BspA type Leucine rich repeat region (6 copies)/Domain of unknown function (DUF6383)
MKKQCILFLCLSLSTISFAQVSKTVNCTAGALSSLLSATEKSTVTKLTLTGAINSRDFTTMRDSMSALTDIDMGAATIEAFQNNLANQIPAKAFYDSLKLVPLKSIVLPSSSKTIGTYAFRGCASLSSVNIPTSVTTINDWAFASCTSLTKVVIPNSVTSLGKAAFHSCSLLDSVSISNAVTIIDIATFFNCTSLTKVTIPPSVTKIGEGAFFSCSLLGNVIMPNTVTSIDKWGFKSTGLVRFNIPTSVTTIGDEAFSNCNMLVSIRIPSSVTSIGKGAFSYCYYLDTLKVDKSVPVDLSNVREVFDFDPINTCKLMIPIGSKAAYKNAEVWMDFNNIIESSDVSSGVDWNVIDGVLLNVIDGSVQVKNAPEGETIRITNLFGIVVYSGVVTSDNVSIPLFQHGVYIVSIGNKSQTIKY